MSVDSFVEELQKLFLWNRIPTPLFSFDFLLA
jgi:hypothetical protein